MPGQEGGTTMHMGCLVDFVLFEPVRDVACWKVRAVARKKALVQCDERITEPVSFLLGHTRDVSADAVSECHLLLLPDGVPVTGKSVISGGTLPRHVVSLHRRSNRTTARQRLPSLGLIPRRTPRAPRPLANLGR